MAKVRITVVQRTVHKDLFDRYVNKARAPRMGEPCALWKDGQQFIVEGFPAKPAGFPCDWAWTDIQRDVAMLLFGASPPWMVGPGMSLPCCSDGVRPVSFLVERIEN
jgi:uncharacterized repeat protein (TIGR04076 family)